MDIRAYFPSSNRKQNQASGNQSAKQSTSYPKKNKSRIIDSDSEEDNEINNRKKKKPRKVILNNRRKRIIDSSDESDGEKNTKKPKKFDVEENKKTLRMQVSESSSEDVSPVKTKSSPVKPKSKFQSKLENLKVTSKFFKEASANEVFGSAPVKRNDEKLKEMKEKLKSFKPDRKDLKLDNDAEFEAALIQLDEIGDNWSVPTSKSKNSKQTKSKSVTNEKICEDKNSTNKAKLSIEIMSAKAVSVEEVELRDSSSSGYFSTDSIALSSDSQSPDSIDTNLDPTVVFAKSRNSNIEKNSEIEIVKLVKKQQSPIMSTEETITNEVANMPSSSKSTEFSFSDDFSLWVEKYKPQLSKKIIGQQGEKSNVNKLIHWLKNWYKNNVGSKKASFVPGGWNKDPTGACFKAALLSGPPGVGKTTTVFLVCKELGFDTVEFNASDTRSKRLLQEEVSELLKCTSLSPYFSKQNSDSTVVTRKHVLVMDEVDGMAGNEDRGGIQELIQLIKCSKVPIICMCNDRNHPKIRSLVNYCFDLRFPRPRLEQIKGYMMSVCYKERLHISSDLLANIITSANHDVRLVLNHLSMLAADKNSGNLEASKKYVKLNAWDVLRKVFSKEDHKSMSIHDKCDLFFFDYGIAPLFVQENYLSVKPLNMDAQNKSKKMELFARAAKCISIGDKIDVQIRQNSSWSLLPTQAIFASFAPGEILAGYCTAQINFPVWLGKNSKKGRMDRLLQEIQIHTRLKISGSKESVNLDYAPHLRDRILQPLVTHGSDGVKDALDMLHKYDLLKDDLDSLQEICQWSKSVNDMSSLDSKVKSAFTRAYNKNPPVRPYSLTAPVKKAAAVDSLVDEDEKTQDSENSDDNADAMIVEKKKRANKKSDVGVTATASTSKVKGKSNTPQNKRIRKK